jgi:hypothetical protein
LTQRARGQFPLGLKVEQLSLCEYQDQTADDQQGRDEASDKGEWAWIVTGVHVIFPPSCDVRNEHDFLGVAKE